MGRGRGRGRKAYDINRDSLNIPASSNVLPSGPTTMLHDRTRCNINFRATVHANRAWNFSLSEIINGKPATSRTWTFIKFYLGQNKLTSFLPCLFVERNLSGEEEEDFYLIVS